MGVNRRFTARERTELYLDTDGVCALCGTQLSPQFHADHVVPHASGGPTTSTNGQPLCPNCNLKKGANMLRSHQSQFVEACRQMKMSASLRRVYCHICPGGGKSALPPIAAHELIPSLGDFLGWITPRENLRNQAEDAFVDAWLRSLLGHNNEIRTATNEADLLRGKIGYATTYQALVAARTYRRNPHHDLFRQKRGILFLDEPNHMALDEEFAAAVQPLVENAAVVVLMGGHFTRHDEKRLAFVNYLSPDKARSSFVDLNENEHQICIRYSLTDATRERALIKINFELHDCEAGWETEDKDGIIEEDQITSFYGASKVKTKRGLYSALSTEFAQELLIKGVEFWRSRQRHNSRSRVCIVSPTIALAERAYHLARKMGVTNIGIATSDDSNQALETIERFKHRRLPHLDALSSVAMVQEGMDVQAADVLICLTHIRSREWIEQMIHRVTRYDRDNSLPWERQFATIFAPRDRFFLDIMAEIKADQAPFVEETIPGTGPGGGDGSKTRPRESVMTNASAHTLDEIPIMSPNYEHTTQAMRLAEIDGAISTTQAHKFFEEMLNNRQATGQQSSTPAASIDPPRIREKRLRDRIKKMQREGYQSEDPMTHDLPERRGKAMWKIFRKRVDDMSEEELEFIVNHPEQWARL
jgi:superfamily II DNA or RNA helicase